MSQATFIDRVSPIAGDEEQFLRAVEGHAAREADTLAAYRRLAQTSSDPLVLALFHLLVEDEERHHYVFRQMASYLRSDVHSPAACRLVPAAAERETLDSIRSFIREEQQGAAELRRLASTEPGLYGGLIALLLELMALDCEKHARILQFLSSQVAR